MHCHAPPILFRAVLWALPPPFLSAYALTYSPNHSPIGLFRGGKWAPNGDAPCAPRMPRLRAPWPRTLPGVRCSVHRHGGRQPTPSHAMMAAKVDNEDPERARRTWHGGRGKQSRGKAAGPEGGPGTRRARRCPSGPHPRRRVLAGLPGGAAPPGCLHHRPPSARGPAGSAGPTAPVSPSWATSASAAWMRQRSWCSQHRGVGRWAPVPRASRRRPRATRLPQPGERLRGLRARRGTGACGVSNRERLGRRPMPDRGVLVFKSW